MQPKNEMRKHNNYIFKRVLSMIGLFNKDDIIEVFHSVDYKVSKSKIEKWKSIKDDSKDPMPEEALRAFFDALNKLSKNQDIVCYYNFGEQNHE